MAPKRRRARAVVDEPLIESPEETPGSGQRFESHLADLAAQPELLAAAAQLLLEQRRRATEASPSTSAAAANGMGRCRTGAESEAVEQSGA